MTLVRLRCRRCKRLLDRIERRPVDWQAHLVVPVCQRCTGRREGRIPELKGADTFERVEAYTIPWEQIRPSLEKAETRGAPVDFLV